MAAFSIWSVLADIFVTAESSEEVLHGVLFDVADFGEFGFQRVTGVHVAEGIGDGGLFFVEGRRRDPSSSAGSLRESTVALTAFSGEHRNFVPDRSRHTFLRYSARTA